MEREARQGRLVWAMALATGMLAGSAAWAQQVQPPVPLQKAPPPSMEVTREGIVELRYTVKADGSVADVELRELFSTPQFSEVARSTAATWRFQPASVDGKPVDYLNRRELMLFTTNQGAVSDAVRDSVDDVSALLSADRHQEAADRLEALLSDGASSIYDFLLLQDMLSSAYLGLNEPHKALQASELATLQMAGFSAPPARRGGRRGPPQPIMVDLLPPELLATALRKRFLLEGSLSHNAAALASYERLRALELPKDDPLHAQAEALRAKLAPEQTRGLLARLEGASWSYSPGLRAVAVADVDGQLDKVNLLCQRRNVELAFEAEVEWNLPPALGNCEVEFVGQPGTRFTVFEFPPAE